MHYGTEEEFELYATGRLAADRSSVLEEHLLVCDPCRLKLDETMAWCMAMRQELSIAEAPRFRLDWSWLRLPSTALAAAALLLLILAGSILYSSGTPLAPLATIQLSAMRGGMTVAAEARETDMEAHRHSRRGRGEPRALRGRA